VINSGLLSTFMERKKVAFLSIKFAQKESEIYFSLYYRLQPFSYHCEKKIEINRFVILTPFFIILV